MPALPAEEEQGELSLLGIFHRGRPQRTLTESVSKCDGGRPVCSACIAKRRPDCVYDAAGDQRRTTALKKKIQHLEQQTGDLKDVIASLMSVSGRVDAHALVQKLQLDGFQGLEAVAEQLRAHGYSSSASTPTSTDVALEPGLQMLFQGADAACPVAAEFQGLRVVLPPWMLPMSPTYTDPGLPSDSDWTQSGCEG